MSKEIMVLGGDGFCGWPTALHLADAGHHVTIVDNQSRRAIDQELGVESLTPITSIEERLETWEEVAGSDKKIDYEDLDVAENADGLVDLLRTRRPDTVVHFAEQRSAPYSMKSPAHKRYTIDNNVRSTNNLITGLEESKVDAHVVHLGTMGVYGYDWAGSAAIPEGYLKIWINADNDLENDDPKDLEEREILYPANAGSVYHMSKTLDQGMFVYYTKKEGVRVTDLHQGIVWGTQTPQTIRDERLINRFDYDGDYGTVLNRFLAQAAIGYPLTVHGTGGQTRGFIHIRDTVRCIELACDNPPEKGERTTIYNQVTQTHRVKTLAELISKMTGVEIAYLPNPRVEAAENDLNVTHDHLFDLGLKDDPTLLSEGLLEEVTDIAKRYADRMDRSKIPATAQWRRPTAH